MVPPVVSNVMNGMKVHQNQLKVLQVLLNVLVPPNYVVNHILRPWKIVSILIIHWLLLLRVNVDLILVLKINIVMITHAIQALVVQPQHVLPEQMVNRVEAMEHRQVRIRQIYHPLVGVTVKIHIVEIIVTPLPPRRVLILRVLLVVYLIVPIMPNLLMPVLLVLNVMLKTLDVQPLNAVP